MMIIINWMAVGGWCMCCGYIMSTKWWWMKMKCGVEWKWQRLTDGKPVYCLRWEFTFRNETEKRVSPGAFRRLRATFILHPPNQPIDQPPINSHRKQLRDKVNGRDCKIQNSRIGHLGWNEANLNEKNEEKTEAKNHFANLHVEMRGAPFRSFDGWRQTMNWSTSCRIIAVTYNFRVSRGSDIFPRVLYVPHVDNWL